LKDYNGAWNNTFSHPEDDHWLVGDDHTLTLPVLTARMGITNNVDIGLIYTDSIEANYGWTGVDVKYAFHQDRRRGFFVATRLSTVVLTGVQDFNYYQGAVDLLVSKKVGWFTPYAGITAIYSVADENTDKVNLKKESSVATEAIVGTQFHWKYLSVAAEADIARINMYTVKIGATF